MIRIFLFAFSLLACFGSIANAQDSDSTAADEETAAEELPSTADRALDELQRAYDGLQRQFDELTGDQLDAPVEWAQEDLENIGDWEYRVIEINRLSAEDLEATLNELGNDRWEVIWIDDNLTGKTIILKRPAVSVLSKLPLSALGRLLMRDSGGQ